MPWFADRARAGIAPLTRDDRDEWIAFQARSHGAEARQADPVWLAWLERNPELDGGPLPGWICRREGGIVGSQGCIPYRVMEAGAVQPAAWAVDLMVDPAWRLRGVGPALTEAQIGAYPLVTALSISEAAHRAYLRGGWYDLGDIPNYVRPQDVGWGIRQSNLHGLRAVGARIVVHSALAATWLGSTLAMRIMRTHLERIDRFDERVDRVWHQASGQYPVIAARDLRALAWRFDTFPDAGRYTRYYLMQGGRVRGYVVTRSEPWRDGSVLAIVDFLASHRWVMPLLGHVAGLAEARTAVAVTCRALIPGSDLAFRAAGFIRVAADARSGPMDRSTGTPLRFMVHRGDAESRPAHDRRQWFVTAGDSDFRWDEDPDD